MPELSRPDGAKIHYEVRGQSGPAVVLATWWTWCPGVYAELLDDLAVDHRFFVYHLRGTGESSRRGPYEMETDSGDLEAVLEAAGGGSVVISTADSPNRAVRVGARRPDLVSAVITIGAGPISRAAFAGREGMIGSDEVVAGFTETFERNYRAGLRGFVEATNPQMNEDEVRERVDAQAEFCPQEPAVGRMRAWMNDDPSDDARALGDRLWIFSAGSVAGPWLPEQEEVDRIARETMPEAHMRQLDPGPISRPDLAAALVRKVTAPLRSEAAADR